MKSYKLKLNSAIDVYQKTQWAVSRDLWVDIYSVARVDVERRIWSGVRGTVVRQVQDDIRINTP